MAFFILTSLSFLALFGFMGFCIAKFGLKDCFSRYSMYYEKRGLLNWWSFDVMGSAALLIPTMLELSEGNLWQFTGFLAPLSLFLVGCTPKWSISNAQYIIHNIGVALAVLFSVIYAILVPGLVWPILILGLVAGVAILIYRKAFVFWLEIAIYLAIYIILFIMLAKRFA